MKQYFLALNFDMDSGKTIKFYWFNSNIAIHYLNEVYLYLSKLHQNIQGLVVICDNSDEPSSILPVYDGKVDYSYLSEIFKLNEVDKSYIKNYVRQQILSAFK